MVIALDQVVVNSGGADWVTAVATLVAVLFGGVVTWRGQEIFILRRQKAERMAATRVIQGEISLHASVLKMLLRDDPRWFAYMDLRVPSWPELKPTLAQALAADEWELVSQVAFDGLGFTDAMRKSFAPGGPREGAPFAPIDADDPRPARHVEEQHERLQRSGADCRNERHVGRRASSRLVGRGRPNPPGGGGEGFEPSVRGYRYTGSRRDERRAVTRSRRW